MVEEKRVKIQEPGTSDIEKLRLEQQEEMVFLQKCFREKLKMRETIRWNISWAGFCDVEIDYLNTHVSSGHYH